MYIHRLPLTYTRPDYFSSMTVLHGRFLFVQNERVRYKAINSELINSELIRL